MTQRGMGLVQFRAKKEAILKLKEEGYGKKLIYIELKEHFDISYSQFTRIWDKEFNKRIPKTKCVQPSKSPEHSSYAAIGHVIGLCV